MSILATWQNRWMRLWSRLWLWPRAGLGTKMALIVIIGIISLISLFAYLGNTALNENIQHSLQERVVVAQTAARHIDYVLASVEHDLTQAAAQDGLSDPSRRAETLREAFARVDFFGRQIFIVDRTGRVAAAYPPIAADLALTDARSVQLVLQGAPFAVSRSARALGSLGKFPLAVAALRDSSGQSAGALVLTFDLASPNLGIFTNSVGLGGSGYMDLVDTEGVVLASTHAERVGQSSDHDTTLAKMIRAQQAFVSRCHNCHTSPAPPDPHPEMLAFAPVTRAPWGVTVRQDEEEVLATARELQWRIFALGAVALAGALLLVYLTTHSVITPVQGLTAATQRIAAGDLETPIEPLGQDEIGVLARSFDSMRSQLNHSIAEIQAWNRELDARVCQRTAELETARQQIQQSRDHLQTIIDSLNDELLVIDPDRWVTRVNAAVQRRHPGDRSLIGSFCYQLTHANRPCQSPDCECPLPVVLQTGKPFRVTHRHCDGGSSRYLEITASPLINAAGRVSGVVELLRDVTEEKELQETLLKRNRELSAVNAIARVVGQSLKLDECLRQALEEVRRITQMDAGAIFLVEGETRALRLHAHYGMSTEGAEATKRLALTDTACGGVLEIGKAVVVLNKSPNAPTSLGTLQREALESLVHVPLIAKGKPLGAMCLGTRQGRAIGEEQVSLLNAIGSQIAVAVENARLYEELSRKEHLRGELLRRVISAQEDERKRIARELHDETTQTLSALLYTLDAAAGTCAAPQTEPLMRKMRQMTVNAIDGVHKIIFDLRPTMLDQLGLVAALRWYAETRLRPEGVRVEFTELGQPQRLPAAVETALFRTVQEAVNNIARHAGARHVHLVFDVSAGQVEIHVEDDGIGFDVSGIAASADPRCGLGLISMQERMSAVSGEFFLASAPGEGTTVLLRVPFEGGNDGADSCADRG